MEHDAILMVDASEQNADLYYATRFWAPDPFIFVQTREAKLLATTDLELDRAKAEARVDRVLRLVDYEERAKQKGLKEPSFVDILVELLEEVGAKRLLVPGDFAIQYADPLRERGFHLTFKRSPFFEERLVKTEEEIVSIEETQRWIERGCDEAVRMIWESEVHDGLLYYEGKVLTSERVRQAIHRTFLEGECVAHRTIVAGGEDAVDPHHIGSGPLRSNQAIVLDLFPRSARTGYFADMTRTVVKGKAPDPLKRMYEAVLAAQERGIALVRDGADGRAVHQEVAAVLEKAGFETKHEQGRMQGFFHGTGHGVGLEIHEPPRISLKGSVLQKGNVVTVEPGLYYSGIGGIRIEDMVVVEAAGCRNLTRYPKQLELD
ncbi:MAG: aminopeptidase P family protein [candidate division NC10 bacterium]|nr:aminopeptidase P family protein [candidate division NC10 bacterium]